MGKRRFRPLSAILCLALIAALAVLVVRVFIPLFDTSDELVDENVEPYGFGGDTALLTLENDDLLFELDPATTQFTVTDKRGGAVWRSTPEGADDDPIALPVEKHRLRSPLTMVYSMSTGMQTMLTSDEFSVENQVYEVLAEEDAVRVNYSLGRISRTYLIPPAITDERLQPFLDNMTKKESRDLLEYYTKKSLDKLKANEDAEALLAQYPDLAEHTVYILRDNVKEHLKAKIEGYFKNAGYTREDYEYDTSRGEQKSGGAAAVFNVSLVYRLEGNDLVVSLPLDSVDYNSAYPIVSVSLLPAFGAGGTEDTGWMLVPDGGGAVIEFNNGRTDQNAYYGNLYGWDWASLRTQVTGETNCPFPVFGVSRNGASFICMLEEGAPWAGISADISGRYTSYNTVYAGYTLLHGDPYDVSDRSNNANYLFEKQLPGGELRQRYRFLQTDTVSGMAAAWREELTKRLPENAPAVGAAAPVNVELLGAIDKVQQRLGVPTTLPVAMTTYDQAADAIRRLTDDGFTDFSVRLTGWMNGGVNQRLLSRVRLVRELGSEDSLRALTALAKERNVPLYLDGLTAFSRHSGLLDGFIAVRDAAKFTTQETAELSEYSTVWYGPDDDQETYWLIKPRLMARGAQTLDDAAARYGAAGVSFRDVGSILSADYNRKDLVTRVESLALQREILTNARAAGLKVLTRKGCDYSALLSDLIVDMDFDGGNYGIINRYVPFWSMALHGMANYTGVSLNLADDWETLLLQSAEAGAGLSFTFTAGGAQKLQDTVYSSYYGADISLAYDRAAALWRRYAEEMDGLNDVRIADIRREGDVAVTEYEDGSRVFVNYGYAEARLDGVTVPARDYAVQRGSAR